MIDLTTATPEDIVLDQVRYINSLLGDVRARNTELQPAIGMIYQKSVGLGSPYEELIHAMRKVKNELDGCLRGLRAARPGTRSPL